MTQGGKRVLYISGEESLQQIKMRAERIGMDGGEMLLLCETNLVLVKEAIQRVKPEIVVIDSIQTMYNEEVSSAPGSVSQGNGNYRFSGGACDKRGRSGRPQSFGTYGRYCSLF